MYLNKINKEQQSAVTYTGKHLLLLAGAGTGKTTTIVSRAAWLINEGSNPERIKIISFTKKSANEIALRTKKILDELSIQKSNPSFFNMNKWTIIDVDDQEVIMKHIIAKYPAHTSYGIKASDILSIRSYQLNTERTIEEATQCTLHNQQQKVEFLTDNIENTRNIIEKYEEYKKAHLYLDYDDILTEAVSALTQCAELRLKVTSMYDHILVDEMQDTNPLQWKLLEIFMPSCHLFCVGDDAQSIYGFRGADFNSIHSFSQRVPDSVIMKLTQNYRSSQAILNLSNHLLELSPLKYDKKLIAKQKRGEKPSLVFTNNKKEEASFIKKEIQKHVNKQAKYADHMILVRNAYQAKQVEATLLASQIPYVLYGGISLMKSAHIRDIISILRIIANPEDELAWMRFLCLWPGIGKVKVRKIMEEISLGKSALEKAKIMMKTEALALPSKVISETFAQTADPTECVTNAIKIMSDTLKEKYANDWERRKKDFATLIEIASSSSSIAGFVSAYLLDSNIDNNSSSDDAVIISTIHSAKGLEADFCYILDMNIGNHPSEIAIKAGADAIEEERRCLYVALTRAIKQLTVMTEFSTWAMTNSFYSKLTTVKKGELFTAIHPTPSDPPFKTAQIASVDGTNISYHAGGKTRYSPLVEFLNSYRAKDEKHPGLSIPCFFFSKINLDLLNCISADNQAEGEKAIKATNNTNFNFF